MACSGLNFRVKYSRRVVTGETRYGFYSVVVFAANCSYVRRVLKSLLGRRIEIETVRISFILEASPPTLHPPVKKFAVVQIFKHREIHLTIQPPRTHPSLPFWDIFSSNLF